jgi:hypothetical protein
MDGWRDVRSGHLHCRCGERRLVLGRRFDGSRVMNSHPMLAVFDMIRRSSMVADERKQNEEEKQRLMGCFSLGDLDERAFSRSMRQIGVDECEINEFIQFVKGDE